MDNRKRQRKVIPARHVHWFNTQHGICRRVTLPNGAIQYTLSAKGKPADLFGRYELFMEETIRVN